MSILLTIFPSILLLISEVLPFLPTKYNGIAHVVYDILKDVYKGIETRENNENNENKKKLNPENENKSQPSDLGATTSM
jgi:hypothetical protein